MNMQMCHFLLYCSTFSVALSFHITLVQVVHWPSIGSRLVVMQILCTVKVKHPTEGRLQQAKHIFKQRRVLTTHDSPLFLSLSTGYQRLKLNVVGNKLGVFHKRWYNNRQLSCTDITKSFGIEFLIEGLKKTKHTHTMKTLTVPLV